MRTLDFAPLYRSSIGFDNLTSLLDTVTQWDKSQPSYPPYNIELVEEDHYRITMAVAGFEQRELDIEVENQTLTVRGRKETDEDSRTFLYKGIAGRGFDRRFRLADHVKVSAAKLENGLLHIELQRELPEAMRPRSIQIQSGDQRLIDVERDKAA
ncbi:MAG: Hsp20 family protein [Gammaproteobacteria bacterium]